MRSFLSLIMVFALFFARAGWADSAPVILVVGDSLSAGYGMELDESWPVLLQARLTEHGYIYRVFNSSIVGDTTEGGLARVPRLLAEYRPVIVIIELGGNDGLRGLPLEVTRKNLQAMIDQSRAGGASIVLAGMRLPPNYGKTYTERFSAMFAELGTSPGVSLIPFLLDGIALDPSLMQSDGIHPVAQAQGRLLQNVWQALESLLK